jgi:diguanylate cyclase (GGDEF)-like protein
MHRLNTLNRVFTALIFVVVGTLASYGYGSLVMDAREGSVTQSYYAWYDSYRTLDDKLAQEVHALVVWAAQPDTPAAWQSFVVRRQAFDAAVASLDGAATSSGDLDALSEIAAQHRAVSAAAHDVMLRHERHDPGDNIRFRTVVNRYEALSSRIEALSQQRFAVATTLNGEFKLLQYKLQLAMIGIGILGMAILMGLAAIVRSYRRRAEIVTEAEMRRLEQAALSDSLTVLGNHRAFRGDLAKEMARSKRHKHPLTLALLDVDDFKVINDTRGHGHGDQILIQTARALDGGRKEDRAYRIGGDEFAVIFVETTLEQARVALERARSQLSQRLSGATVSIGFCQMEDSFDEHDLYERADAALYEAKRNGRNGIVDFATIQESATVFSTRKTAALQLLVDRGSLHIAFQPIWNIRTKEVLGFEALARPDPELGFSGPQEAFDIAERLRRNGDLDHLCVRRTLAVSGGLAEDHSIFVNITPETLRRGDLDPRKMAKDVEKAGLQTRQIVVEITERRIADAPEMLRMANRLRDCGFLVALDDTGSGYAGLEVLSKFTFDFVKIDRLVVANAIHHRRARAVLCGISAIAREGGSYVVAEGVETMEQLAFLKDILRPGEDEVVAVQGYLLGRPQQCKPVAASFASYAHVLDAPVRVAS